MIDRTGKIKSEYIGKWITKADNDLTIAKDERFLKKDNIITDGICFHCQQTVEKYLKAFLADHDVDFGKTHNLEKLAVIYSEIDADFQNLSFGNLSEYGVSIRYPDDFYMPTIEEADECIKVAEQTRGFVLSKMGKIPGQ